MSADSPSDPGHLEPSRRLPPGVDPIEDRQRLESVSESRADVYGAHADAARELRMHLDQTEDERRSLELLRADLMRMQLPHNAMLDLTSLIREGASYEELLQRILEQSLSIFEAQKASILIPDNAQRALRVAAARSLSAPVREDFQMRVNQGVAGRAFEQGHTVVVLNTAECDFFEPGNDREHEPRYLLAVPLQAEGDRLGVLCSERPVDMPATPAKVAQLEAFAAHASVQLRNIKVYERLLRQVDELTVLCDISRELSSSLEHEQLLQKIVESAVNLLDCGICSLMLFDDEKQGLRIRHAVGLPAEVVARAAARPGEGVTGWVAESGLPLLIEDITQDPRFQRKERRQDDQPGKYTTQSLLSVPLLIGTEVVGVLNVNNKADNAVFTSHDLANLTMLASQAAVSIENARLYETLQRLAVTDPLTKLFRRNYFEEQLETELGRCRRYGRPLSVMMLDIDHFKNVNDTYGHAAGDVVLQGLAGLLRRYGRKDDVIARYGGEEFVAYLVETDLDGARLAAERVRSAAEVQDFAIPDGRTIRVTISVGTAGFPADADDVAQLVQRADLALYAAKHGGRNQVQNYYDGLEMPTGEPADDR